MGHGNYRTVPNGSYVNIGGDLEWEWMVIATDPADSAYAVLKLWNSPPRAVHPDERPSVTVARWDMLTLSRAESVDITALQDRVIDIKTKLHDLEDELDTLVEMLEDMS